VTYKTAWRMGNEIRKHMGAVDGDAELGGAGVFVEIDETVVGGIQSVEERAPGGTNKTIVLGMMERGGDLVTVVVSNQKRATLMPHIVKHVDGDSIVHTYENPSYNLLRDKGYDHYSVNHRVREHSARTARRSIASKTSGGT
jgi:transposase-like protein